MKNVKLSPSLFRKLNLFLLPVITIAIVLVLTSYFLVPKISETQELLAKVDTEKKQLAVMEKKAQKLKELENTSLAADFTRLEYILPSEKNLPVIIDSLSQLELENSVLIEGISLSPGLLNNEDINNSNKKTNTPEDVGTLTFSIIVSGSQDNLLAFLSKLQSSSPYFKINSIRVDTTKGLIKASLNLSTYYQSLPTKLGKIDAPLKELSASQKKTLELTSNFLIFSSLSTQIEPTNQSTASAQPTPEKSIFQL